MFSLLILIKNVFIVLFFLLQIATVICISLASTKHSIQDKALERFHIVSLVTIVLFEGTLLVEDEFFAGLFQSLYFASIDWFLYAFMYYIAALAGNKKMTATKASRAFNHSYIFLAVVDTVILASNFYHGWAFSLNPYLIEGSFYCWICDFGFYYSVHLTICYLIIAIILLEICYRLYAISKMYKSKYIFILVMFVIVLVMNAVFMAFMKYVMIDFSTLVFAILSISLYIFNKYRMPKKLESEILLMVSQNISNPVICFDQNKQLIYKNKNAELLLQSPGILEWCNTLVEDDFEIEMQEERLSVLNEKNELEEHIFNIEYKKLKSDGNALLGSFISFEDKTKEKRNIEQEAYRAHHDELTGFLNRLSFFQKVAEVIRENPEEPRYMICSNIRKFKMINELFGTSVGDDVLKYQADMLSKAKFPEVVLGRIGADRFAMLINKKYFNPELAKKNTELVKEYFKNKNFIIDINLGIYEITNPDENPNAMYDKGILAIKNAGEEYNRVLNFYDSSLMTKLIEEKEIISSFQLALESNQISMFLQPQVDAKTGKCVGAEALSRWYHVTRGMLNPARFISILEQAGLVYKLDYYMWKKAVQKLSEWERHGIHDLYISVNVSPKDFYLADLYKDLTELVEFYNVDPKRINLEITETIVMENKKFYNSVIRKLSNYGFSIEMDDFGSGYSSFMSLKNLKMDVLKIDMEFLRESEVSERSKKILTRIIKMGKNLGMKIVTEGVETEANVKFLSENGCDYLQGYYYSRPISVSDFEERYMEDLNA